MMDPPPGTPRAPTISRLPGRRWNGALAAGLVLLLAGAAVAFVLRRGATPSENADGLTPAAPVPPDPRLDYAGPFLNVRPEVRYVGDAACDECHADKAESYRQHPMGRSLLPISDVLGRAPHGPAKLEGQFEAFESRFRVERRGEQVWHRQTRLDAAGRPIYTQDHEVGYVIGSGTRGHSYLSERDGFLFQTPVSWFSQKGVWDLSPGFSADMLPGRPISPDCLFCHANRARHREGTRNGYEAPIFDGCAIGCERCHGPGELHARSPGRKDPATGADYTIVNPHHLEAELRAAVCEQCHLAGESRVLCRGRDLYDFRPGLPLSLFLSVFVADRSAGSGTQKAVNHVEQMHLSPCFLRSKGDKKLGCTSCHDPHVRVGPEQRVAHYREKCLACHDARQAPDCGLAPEVRRRQNRADSCIDCHMPTYPAADIAHTAATNHQIARHPPQDRETAGQPNRDKAPARPPVSFYPARVGDAEQMRDLGVALARLAAGGKGDPPRLAGRAAELLEESLTNCPDDVYAWEARAQALTVLGRQAEARAAFEAALARSPRRELSLQGAARLAQTAGDLDQALACWRRAVEVNPQAADAQGNLARLLIHTGAWDEARPHCRAWLRLDPGSVEARKLWARCLLHDGDRAAAREEMDRLQRLR
jgi:hypothetical protein